MSRSVRRRGRESALQVLYQMDRGGDDGSWQVDLALQDYFANFDHPEKVRDFVEDLVQGVVDRRSEIDQHIEATSTKWRLERMSLIDRNLLRLGAFELFFRPETPRGVVINEAVEIARRFGSESSPAFVNGILDELGRQAEQGRGSA